MCNRIFIISTRLNVPIHYFRVNSVSNAQFDRGISHITSASKVVTALADKLTKVSRLFDSVLGISEVREAQSSVQKEEIEFMKSRHEVQETRIDLVRLQNDLRELRSKLDRLSREDERYLQLATEEHKALLAERKTRVNLETLETLERDKFAALSAAVRGAHEKERSRAERTKYWSIIGSACGAVLGILGSTIINSKRMKQIKVTVQENNEAFTARTMDELRALLKTGKHRVPTSKDDTNSEVLNDFLALLNQNNKMLEVIGEKVEKVSRDGIFASSPKDNVISLINGEEIPNYPNSLSFVEQDSHMKDVVWWTKASLIASVTTTAFIIFHMLSK